MVVNSEYPLWHFRHLSSWNKPLCYWKAVPMKQRLRFVYLMCQSNKQSITEESSVLRGCLPLNQLPNDALVRDNDRLSLWYRNVLFLCLGWADIVEQTEVNGAHSSLSILTHVGIIVVTTVVHLLSSFCPISSVLLSFFVLILTYLTPIITCLLFFFWHSNFS